MSWVFFLVNGLYMQMQAWACMVLSQTDFFFLTRFSFFNIYVYNIAAIGWSRG
jgi:hypothetical protein